MDPQQLPKTLKLYSICSKCDMQETAGGGYHPTFGSPRVKRSLFLVDRVLTALIF